MHGSRQVAMRGISVIAPVARGVLNVIGQPPIAHQQPAEARLKFCHEIGKRFGIHDGALLRLELREDFQCQCRAGAVHQRGQECTLDVLAPFACDLLGPQARQPCFAP
jgi:hypothetical protein